MGHFFFQIILSIIPSFCLMPDLIPSLIQDKSDATVWHYTQSNANHFL